MNKRKFQNGDKAILWKSAHDFNRPPTKALAPYIGKECTILEWIHNPSEDYGTKMNGNKYRIRFDDGFETVTYSSYLEKYTEEHKTRLNKL